MDMGIIILLWIVASFIAVWDNFDVLNEISIWRSLVATVILTLTAPVFFLCDFLELILDFIIGEES